jgi:hypothetical protein
MPAAPLDLEQECDIAGVRECHGALHARQEPDMIDDPEHRWQRE